jgi:acetyl-CoA carboxylase biotin carboxyl carrier protein
MDLRQIKNILKEFEDSSIDMLEIEEKDFRIKMEKRSCHSTQYDPPLSSPVSTDAATAQVAAVETVKEELVPVKAPLVGTFYQAPSPDAPPFVRVDQAVEKGQTICIIEAMKVMNEIVAPVSGTIKTIHVSDASLVEFGQIIMEIQP